jgi:hypothetical protein
VIDIYNKSVNVIVMTPLSHHRSYRNFGCKAKGLTIIRDTKPDSFFYGWTVRLGINGDSVLFGYSQNSLHEAMDELRYKLSRVAKVIGMNKMRWWRFSNSNSRNFSADFSGQTHWCRKTLYLDREERPELKLHIEARNRNNKGQWLPRDKYVNFTIFGDSIKEIKQTWNGLVEYAKHHA